MKSSLILSVVFIAILFFQNCSQTSFSPNNQEPHQVIEEYIIPLPEDTEINNLEHPQEEEPAITTSLPEAELTPCPPVPAGSVRYDDFDSRFDSGVGYTVNVGAGKIAILPFTLGTSTSLYTAGAISFYNAIGGSYLINISECPGHMATRANGECGSNFYSVNGDLYSGARTCKVGDENGRVDPDKVWFFNIKNISSTVEGTYQMKNSPTAGVRY